MLELELENTAKENKDKSLFVSNEDLNSFLSNLKIIDTKTEELDDLIIDFCIDRLDEKHKNLQSLVLLYVSLFMLNITLLTEKSIFYVFIVILVNIGSIFLVKNRLKYFNKKYDKKLEYINEKSNDLAKYVQESNIAHMNVSVSSNKLNKKINQFKSYLIEKYKNVTFIKKNKISNKLSFNELSDLSIVFDLKKLIKKIEEYQKKNNIKKISEKNEDVLKSMYEL